MEVEKADRLLTDTRPAVPETNGKLPETERPVQIGQPDTKPLRPVAKEALTAEVLSADRDAPDRSDANADTVIPDEQPQASAPGSRRQPAKQTDMGPQPAATLLSGLPDLADVQKQRKERYRWSAGVQAGSNAMIGAGMGSQGYLAGPPDTTDPGYTDPDNPNEPEVQTKAIPSSPRRTDGDAYEYEHKFQLSTGFMLRRQLSDRLGVETGLSYSYLYSDIRKVSNGQMAGNQKVHYLGVPLRANWICYRQGRFTAYLSAGAMLEYSLSAHIHLEDIRYTPDINRWEWSLNAAVGAQYTVAKPVSLFLEPGVSYYFDRNERHAFETIRTANPVSFSLQLGVRFSY